MLTPEQFFSWDARENKAIARLVPALDEAVASGRPIAVELFQTSLDNRQLVALAVDLIKRAEMNVAVLADGTQKALTFVPLAVTLFIRQRRPRTTQREQVLVGSEVFI
jgi:N-acetylglucosamine kinase-like BadF-type ATPase